MVVPLLGNRRDQDGRSDYGKNEAGWPNRLPRKLHRSSNDLFALFLQPLELRIRESMLKASTILQLSRDDVLVAFFKMT